MTVVMNEFLAAAKRAVEAPDQRPSMGVAAGMADEFAAMPAAVPATIRFEVRADVLGDLTRIIDLRSNSSEPNLDPVFVSISPKSMTLEAARRTVVCRVRAALNSPPGESESAATSTVSLPHFQLQRLGRAFKGLLRCEVDPAQAEIRISQKNARFVLSAAAVQAPSAWPELDGATPVKCDPRLLAKALRFVGLLARANRAQPEFSVVQVTNGRCIGGVPHELAVFESSALEGLEFRVAAQDATTVADILMRLNPANTAVVQGQDWQIIGDGVIECSIAKPMHRFPPVDAILKSGPAHRFFATKHNLSDQLLRLAALHAVRRGKASLEMRHVPDEIGKLHMRAQNNAMGFGETSLDIDIAVDEPAPTIGFQMTVPLAPLARVVNGTWDPMQRVEFGVFEGKVLLLTEEHEGEGYRTRAYIAAWAAAIE